MGYIILLTIGAAVAVCALAGAAIFVVYAYTVISEFLNEARVQKAYADRNIRGALR